MCFYFCWFSCSINKYWEIISAKDRFPICQILLIYIVDLSFSDELNPSLGVVGMWDRGESGLTAHVSGLGSYTMGIVILMYA